MVNLILENELFEAFSSASENVFVYVCDVKTDLSRWSKHAVDFFGLEDEYIQNAGEKWMEKIHPLDRAIYAEDIGNVFSGKSDHHSCQYRAQNRYGEYVWLECKGKMIKNSNNEPVVFAGMMTRLDNQNKFDPLTGLRTIYSFYEYDFKGKTGVAILLGIDNFRRVVSNYSYSFGDEVLVEFSKMLKNICSDKMHLYRMIGDEFLVINPNGDEKDAKKLFDEICSIISNISLSDGRHISLSVSAGAVRYIDCEKTRDILLNNMENTLEYIKNNNRGHIAFFSTEIQQVQKRVQMIKDDLNESINNGFAGFELYFQPLVAPDSELISGCEALLRWKGSKIKDSYPGEFVKILEENGGIIPVGLWVMEQAVKYQKRWQDKFGDIIVSFNVSYQQFMEKSFVDSLIACVKKYDVNPSSMIVELTESCKVEQPEGLAAIFNKLEKEGFNLALDDFGTAYSSLEILKKVSSDFIKIEHSFVRELSEEGHEVDYIIIENLMHLCSKLNCKAIIEGVENEKVRNITKHMGAEFLQGYYYSRPVSAEQFEAMLEKNRSA